MQSSFSPVTFTNVNKVIPHILFTELPKILVICGPTATGKSALAIALAKKFKGEVVSADSRQVYKGMNIGTGKVTKKEMSGIPHHLLDIASPKKVLTVENFKHRAQTAISDILDRGKLPILCGGTGFYIQSVIDNVELPPVPPNPSLRKKLEKKSINQLFALIKKIDPRRAKELDTNNKVRLIRAIEIGTALGSIPKLKSKPLYNPLFIGLDVSTDELQEKIRERLKERLKKGMIREVQQLHTAGMSWKRLYELGLEYRYISLFLREKLSRHEMETQLFYAIWHFAKRQRTWFRKDKRIQWFHPKDSVKIFMHTKRFLDAKNRPLPKK